MVLIPNCDKFSLSSAINRIFTDWLVDEFFHDGQN